MRLTPNPRPPIGGAQRRTNRGRIETSLRYRRRRCITVRCHSTSHPSPCFAPLLNSSIRSPSPPIPASVLSAKSCNPLITGLRHCLMDRRSIPYNIRGATRSERWRYLTHGQNGCTSWGSSSERAIWTALTCRWFMGLLTLSAPLKIPIVSGLHASISQETGLISSGYDTDIYIFV